MLSAQSFWNILLSTQSGFVPGELNDPGQQQTKTGEIQITNIGCSEYHKLYTDVSTYIPLKQYKEIFTP